MERWQNINNLVVVGLGITGLSVVQHVTKRYPHVTVRVMDSRDNPPGKDELPSNVALHSGSFNLEWLLNADLVVCNPGIALATPEITAAIQANVPVVGDIELFAWSNSKPVIAITGSNGKSTVTDLTGVLARAAGLNVGVGGNIGVPALDLLDIDADLYVLELSSFQLETTSSLRTRVSAFLNLSEDHMDRYQGMEDYAQAKRRIFTHAEHLLVNRDEPETYPNTDAIQGRLHQGKLHTFGSDANDFGMQISEHETGLLDQGELIVQAQQLKLIGKHNWSNALVACALLKLAGIDYRNSLTALKDYSGLSHRCQVVAQRDSVTWVNDSKATNVASTLAALSGLQLEGKLYLLVGGVGKGADFSDLKPALSSLNVALCCFGKDGQAFLDLHSSAKLYDSMDEVIDLVTPQLKAGDMVMLSPACASFDQFANFMARGDHFTTLAEHYSQNVNE
ncbi:UDP-N-acetylmuramoyl-L-alanine--D-glutamate ligase [Vibrio hippocampi]|uniref:UDP-N-acetylmuramoylalanine--D-glutamate ligase n=1 Tax=Vibrio hippocampi TaxID=654686 RepID=A0ABN8DJ17_9VIBR|nr:UDP-N-acetylmuramoyl-L-alanine--D-glutamate ligase [Vibrio hippocampi]CAH0527080.1 UDP-N-acetylmuramoylalanine--D-glutamate ligase [Vibrio hippocampi]